MNLIDNQRQIIRLKAALDDMLFIAEGLNQGNCNDEMLNKWGRAKAVANWQQVDEEPARCECGELLEGQYNNGEEHDECAICRESGLVDEAYERGRYGVMNEHDVVRND